VKTTKDKIENRQAYLTIEMEPSEVEDGLSRAYSRLVRKANVPGFRKGKAPRALLEQYLGKAALLEDAVEHMAPEVFEKAVKEMDLKPIARPQIELEKIEPVTYKMIVSLEPITKLGDYHQIKVAQESVQLKEEDVSKAIEQLRHQHGIWEPVDRQVNSSDLVNLDIESNVGAQPFINQKDAEFQVEKESEFPIKGFAEELIGLKKGEKKEFKLAFAQEHPRAELAGKEVQFKIDIKEIKQEKLPTVDDEFAKLVNAEYKTVEDLMNKVKESLQISAEQKAKKDFEQKVIDEVVKQTEVEYPPVIIEEEIDMLIRDQMRRWQMDEKGMDEYLKTVNRTPEQLREELRPVAIRTVTQSLVLSEVARAEKIEIGPNDVQSEIEAMTKEIVSERRDQLVELLNQPQSQVNIASSVATRKTVEKLVEIAKAPAGSEQKVESAEAQSAEAQQKEA
jgi:trigger factor